MNHRQFPKYALVAGLVAVGAVWAGVPISTVVLLAIMLACPLMMVFMHGGHGPGKGEHHNQQHLDQTRSDRPASTAMDDHPVGPQPTRQRNNGDLNE